MKQLFDGTPVAIASEPDGSMRVDVPMTFSFDDKSNAPKPPLRAVMDKVAVSMARQASTKVQLASPGAGGARRRDAQLPAGPRRDRSARGGAGADAG